MGTATNFRRTYFYHFYHGLQSCPMQMILKGGSVSNTR